MKLNDLRPSAGARRPRKRVGRGESSGMGKTCGRGQKGQKSRSGAPSFIGFEGGQMPIQRRLPKFGFKSRVGRTRDEVRLDDLALVDAEVIDLDVLKAAKLVQQQARRVKVLLSGELNKAITLKGLFPTKGARAAIEAAGGRIEE
jgi:large subunit ribosomal protein L15